MEARVGDPASWSEVAHQLLERGLESSEASPRLQVQGSCMEPLIRDGDWVTVSSRVEPVAGDLVVACPGGGEMVCHRVLRREEGGLQLAGDRSRSAARCASRHLLGRVESIERDGRCRPWVGPSWIDRLLTGLHRSSVAEGMSRGTRAGRVFEAVRRRLRSAYSGLAA